MRPKAIDDQWMTALKRGERSAQDRLLVEWLPTVIRWAGRLGNGRLDPEDVAHDVFIVALRRIDQVYSADRLGAWLFGITRRVVASYRRRAWFRRWVPGVAADPTDRVGPVHLFEVGDARRRVQEALATLSPADQEILLLCSMEDRPDSEVADMLGIPRNTVKSRLFRARARFAEAARKAGIDVDAIAPEPG